MCTIQLIILLFYIQVNIVKTALESSVRQCSFIKLSENTHTHTHQKVGRTAHVIHWRVTNFSAISLHVIFTRIAVVSK